MLWLRLILLSFFTISLTGASKSPSAYDGYAEAYVSDGKQNYPVTLYGVARDWDKACRKGRADQCSRLATALTVGEGDLVPDLRAAIGYHLLACGKGAATGCVSAAELVREGRAYPPIPALAYQTAQRGCALKDNDSCAAVALHLYRGDAVAVDKARAVQMWDAACPASGSGDACRLKAGALFYESQDSADQAAAIRLYQKACDAKQGWGCSGLADAYARGRGLTKNDAMAASTARNGCLNSTGDTVLACAIHARYLSNSTNPADVGRASMLLTTACLAKVGEACNDAGLMAKRKPSGSKFADWEIALSFRNGCDLNYGPACGNLGQLYDGGYGDIEAVPGYAVALYDKGCRLGDAASCQRVKAMGTAAQTARAKRPAIDPSLPAAAQLAEATRIAKAGQGAQALSTVTRLMREAVPDAEWLLGGWYYYGEPGVVATPNKKDGFILFDNAARQGNIEALKWVGMAYWEGNGVAQDRKKAMGYMRAAATRDDPMAMAIYRSMQNEPVRQANARRQKEMEAAAAQQRASWSKAFSAASSRWSSSSSSSSSYSSSAAASASWQRYQARADQTNFNNYVSYSTGRTSACASSNPYCR
jgi:uncharacterized protein